MIVAQRKWPPELFRVFVARGPGGHHMSARIVLQLSRAVRRRLERITHKNPDPGIRTRARIVLLYQRGWGAHRIAEALGCVPATAVRVVNRFMQLGEEGLLDGRRDNGMPKVDADLLQALAELINESPEELGCLRPTWTRELLARTLSEQTGVRVSVTTLARMLKQLKARWGMARPIVLCPWPKARKARRVREILRIVESLPRGEVAFYQDEVDIHLNPRIGRDWMLPGTQKLVVTPGQNKRRYIAGALAVGGGDLVFVQAERKNSALFVALLEKLVETYPKARRIHLVVDNYSIHSSRMVRDYLARLDDLVVLHFLPPYSPEHNDIERLWREVHANVTRNHRCRTIDDLMDRVTWYLRRQARQRRRSHGTINRQTLNRRAVA